MIGFIGSRAKYEPCQQRIKNFRTLGDAVDLIDEGLPETLRFRSTWREVKEMLVTAAETRTSRAVEDATTLLEHILEDEGWLEH